MTTKFLAILVSAVMLGLVIELLRRERLTFKYAFGWMAVSVLAIVCVIFDDIIFGLSKILGFELPSNFIFFSLLSVFVFLCLLMTVFLCQQNSRNDAMAQKIGLLEFELKQLKDKQSSGAEPRNEQ